MALAGPGQYFYNEEAMADELLAAPTNYIGSRI